MESISTNLLQFRLLDVLDILVVALIIYYVYNLIRGTIAVNIFIGLCVIYLGYVVVQQAQMRLLTQLLGGFISLGFIALVIVFQQEIRRFLLLVGKNASLQKNKAWWVLLFGKKEEINQNISRLKPIIDACKSMQKSKTGALIIFAKHAEEPYFQNTGELLEATVSKRLLESIFQKNSPLHDGAVIIAEGKIKTASTILPLTENDRLPAHFGLRHRAGIGISEVSDVLALIISEETGELSYARQGKVKMKASFSELEKLLLNYY
ncbi:MAG: diadenylate cyclase CdaA [Sphingobacteriaceae bacterium]